MLKVGDSAPPIDAVASDGKRFVLADQGGLCTVVYFFPKAFTPGCTVETKNFRDNFVELALAGARLVGISTDNLATACSFATSTKAPFPLIGDTDRAISRAYDVLWPLVGLARRITFVVSPELRIEAIFRHELAIGAHRDEVLRFVNDRFLAVRRALAPAGDPRS